MFGTSALVVDAAASQSALLACPPIATTGLPLVCHQGHIGGLEFTVVDTGGLDDRGGLEAQMLPFTTNVLKTADVVLFLVDARRGVTPDDRHFGQYVCWQPFEVLDCGLASCYRDLLPWLLSH